MDTPRGRARLRKVGEETLTFDVFKVDVDPDDEADFRKDPFASIREAIEAEGFDINSLAMDEKMLTAEGDGALATASTWHCTSPPDKKSKWITVLSESR